MLEDIGRVNLRRCNSVERRWEFGREKLYNNYGRWKRVNSVVGGSMGGNNGVIVVEYYFDGSGNY